MFAINIPFVSFLFSQTPSMITRQRLAGQQKWLKAYRTPLATGGSVQMLIEIATQTPSPKLKRDTSVPLCVLRDTTPVCVRRFLHFQMMLKPF